ncbi:hypothetical protein IMCGPPIG_04451 [Stenotrophomonas maltophilia]|nr:hypothetical protein PLCFDHLH_04455 [Stenotrophomonas maltophilia]QNG93176.1 hypothetical protein IMCGPPIG_04451 [Stenotrophomonas maltophilia]
MAAAQVATDVPVQQGEYHRHHQQQAQRAHLVVEQGQACTETGQQPGQDALRRAGDILGAQRHPQHQDDQHGGQHEQVMRRLAERMQGHAVSPVR